MFPVSLENEIIGKNIAKVWIEQMNNIIDTLII